MEHTPTNDFFEFPVKCDGWYEDQVACRRMNGDRVHLPASDIQKLMPILREPYALDANMKFADSASQLQRVLEQQLPSLQHLRIETLIGFSEDHDVRLDYPFTFNLRGAALPGLYTLVDRYITCSYPGETVAPPVLSLMNHRQLQELRFREHPSVMHRILSSLVIPEHVSVVAAGATHNRLPGGVILEMLPDDRAKLPILRCATYVGVTHSVKNECRVYGGTSGLNGSEFRLEVGPIHAYTMTLGNVGERKPDGVLIDTMVQQARKPGADDGFDVAHRVQSLPDVESLTIQEIRDKPEDYIHDLCVALTSPARTASRRQELVFPRLLDFTFQAAVHESEMLHGLCNCFAMRAQNGAQMLRKMKFILTSETKWSEAAMQSTRCVLVYFAKDVDLTVNGVGPRPLPGNVSGSGSNGH
ncbi:uncharacterized protein TRAVEDRAFT_20720 [Trametes versicolor FP-101664 SS1]|uniref:uncharacterized protein n=1 Tax=Trametes versicolor (strain FP-101664) TaxID=717944 RepID=UPI0004623418|nr:uncharacterized protein TRAVEDRAFT_20720 [Trametes versicolor FP-101664 SS1]EIW58832.1 hypothetical protein TRAVEDRAFT_20720 [Trametes versicolor FP-101664 SS1]